MIKKIDILKFLFITTSIDNSKIEIEEENLTKIFSDSFGYDISIKIF